MYRIIYRVKETEIDQEISWLKTQKVYPSSKIDWTWDANMNVHRFFRIGAIVDEICLMSIKLRRDIDICTPYKK